ncbi:DUF481 domain-containing protein [Novosphingobium album (ex Hu et al. 2023)]|uniref:DUF481 domain-containing protein n=1 Tax=Novosphingobium album (ex Hu et al. 2023) TaxID=2930093 RepID=A0ABT0AXX1_9SPHN|nr:DUF481 domain-containing protein [Novosphingobium album (ex Hu et al. 2023)]MCJ2177564.1 DUF481 domain-containing protein [Novosphingobium album (ex Hu et al. 2023)]
MTKSPPVLAILPFLVVAHPAVAQVLLPDDSAADDTALEEVLPAGPLRVEVPPFVDPVPFIDADPPRLAKPVRKLLEAAMKTEDTEAVAALVKFARQTNPFDKDEIDAMNEAYVNRHKLLIERRAEADRERIRRSGVLELWKGQIELGAFRSTGNTSNFGYTGAVKLDRKGIDWQHTIQLNADYQKDTGTVTREQYGASYQPRYTLHDGVFTYGRLQYEKDEIQGFSDRYSASGGFGYRVIKSDDMNLSVEAGPALRRTNYVADPNETTWSALTTLDFDWRVNGTLKLTQNATSYIGSDDSTFTSLTGLEAGMARGLKAKLSYSIKHETSPAAGTLPTDTISRFSLVYGF